MYTIAFYTLLISIIFSIFVKFNPDFLEKISENFFDKGKVTEEILKTKKIEKKNLKDEKNSKILKENLSKDFKSYEERGDFYRRKNFIELAINEYNREILEIKKFEEKGGDSEKFLETKKRIFEKLYKNQNLIGEYKKAEKNILNLISISTNEDFLFDLIRNKINQKDLEKAQLILNRVKNKNYKFYYFDFILNLDTNDNLETLENKFNNLKKITLKYGDLNYKSKISVLDNSIEEFKTYRDSSKIHLYTLIGKALTNSFEFEVSNKILWSVLTKREDYRDARIIFGYNKIRQGEAKKGLNILIGAENIDSTKPEIQFYKAIAYEDLEDLIKAKHNFLTSLKNGYEPKSQIYQKLAEIYFKEGDFGESIEYYKKMLSVNSGDVKYFLLPFEIAVEKQKDFKLAIKIAQWANRRHPENALAKSILGYGYFLNGDLKNAKISLKKSFELDGELARNYLYAGELSIKEGQITNALKQLEIAYKKDQNGKIGDKAIKLYNELIK